MFPDSQTTTIWQCKRNWLMNNRLRNIKSVAHRGIWKLTFCGSWRILCSVIGVFLCSHTVCSYEISSTVLEAISCNFSLASLVIYMCTYIYVYMHARAHVCVCNLITKWCIFTFFDYRFVPIVRFEWTSDEFWNGRKRDEDIQWRWNQSVVQFRWEHNTEPSRVKPRTKVQFHQMQMNC